jgi:hypothetical protein
MSTLTRLKIAFIIGFSFFAAGAIAATLLIG